MGIGDSWSPYNSKKRYMMNKKSKRSVGMVWAVLLTMSVGSIQTMMQWDGQDVAPQGVALAVPTAQPSVLMASPRVYHVRPEPKSFGHTVAPVPYNNHPYEHTVNAQMATDDQEDANAQQWQTFDWQRH